MTRTRMPYRRVAPIALAWLALIGVPGHLLGLGGNWFVGSLTIGVLTGACLVFTLRRVEHKGFTVGCYLASSVLSIPVWLFGLTFVRNPDYAASTFAFLTTTTIIVVTLSAAWVTWLLQRPDPIGFRCPSCGHLNSEDRRSCARCGAWYPPSG